MRHRHTGASLTPVLIATSIAVGIALAITCSYRPIALWWVMVGCSAVNLLRFGARRSSIPRPAGAAASDPRLAWVKRKLARRHDPGGEPAGAGGSKASLDRQNLKFLIWFTEHNLLWTTIGFGGSLLLWHRFGPMTPALVVMAALMSCGVLAASGAVIGARTRGLGLCWREPGPTPDFRSIARLASDVGTVLVLRQRHEYAAARDWSKGGRFHELFLAIDDLDRAGVEPGLAATLDDGGAVARRALARKERVDRALALAPVFVTGLVAAALIVPPLAGTEPLPSLWDIVTRGGSARSSSSTSDGDGDGTPLGASRADRKSASARPGNRAPQSGDGGARESTSPSTAPSGNGAPSGDQAAAAPASGTPAGGEAANQTAANRTGQGGQPGDGVGTGQGNGQGRDGDGGAAAGSGQGAGGRPGASDSADEKSHDSGGKGGGPYGYGTSGPAPERADSPVALPTAAPNPGQAIEVVLPPFSQSRTESPGDNPAGDKRKSTPPTGAPAYQPQRDATPAPHEATSREPVQRWPNWVFRLLHKQPED